MGLYCIPMPHYKYWVKLGSVEPNGMWIFNWLLFLLSQCNLEATDFFSNYVYNE